MQQHSTSSNNIKITPAHASERALPRMVDAAPPARAKADDGWCWRPWCRGGSGARGGGESTRGVGELSDGGGLGGSLGDGLAGVGGLSRCSGGGRLGGALSGGRGGGWAGAGQCGSGGGGGGSGDGGGRRGGCDGGGDSFGEDGLGGRGGDGRGGGGDDGGDRGLGGGSGCGVSTTIGVVRRPWLSFAMAASKTERSAIALGLELCDSAWSSLVVSSGSVARSQYRSRVIRL